MNKAGKRKHARILAAAVIVALLIVVGGTFAWFTSQEEVTNRLTAEGNYGVSITESFTPEEDWVPGQEVNKDVSTVNTGNVDAFVRVGLESSLAVTVKNTAETTETAPTSSATNYITLDDAEVKAAQAGGYLYDAAGKTWEAINSETYKPDEDGLYVFRKLISIETDDDKVKENYEYDGYYYYGSTYYAVELSGSAESGFTAQYCIEEEIKPAGITVDYSEVTSKNRINVIYNAGTSDVATDDIVIHINLVYNDEEEEKWNDSWTFDGNGTFYYNYILGSGQQSAQLVDSLTLDENVSNEAYLSFVYDLTVKLDSVQATTDASINDADGETHYSGTTAVSAAWADVTSVTTATTYTDGKGVGVTWTLKSSDTNTGSGNGTGSDAGTDEP